MNEGYALRHLRKIMDWSFEVDNRETIWLRMMSDFKYDSYRDFWAGSRFVEALLDWLQQFNSNDRAVAYEFIRQRLIFISFTEMQHLANRTLPVHARQMIASRVAKKGGVPKYLVWSQPSLRKDYQDTLNRTLFIGLSDGARIDGFAACGLPLILEHNTPNNSLGLLWAESPTNEISPPHRMRPLFRRRQRHT